MTARKNSRIRNVTDRALRYRANAHPPRGQRICAFCGSTRNVEIGHVDGHEENTNVENLIWNCRRCNTQMGVIFKRAGLGRRTRQYNAASDGAKSLGQWLTAVMAMKGESDEMSVPAAVAMIHATPAMRRSAFAREIWQRRRARRSEVPF